MEDDTIDAFGSSDCVRAQLPLSCDLASLLFLDPCLSAPLLLLLLMLPFRRQPCPRSPFRHHTLHSLNQQRILIDTRILLSTHLISLRPENAIPLPPREPPDRQANETAQNDNSDDPDDGQRGHLFSANGRVAWIVGVVTEERRHVGEDGHCRGWDSLVE